MSKISLDFYKIKNMNSGLGQFSWRFSEALAQHAPNEWSLFGIIPPDSKKIASRYQPIKTNLLNRIFENSKEFDLWHSLHQFPAHFPKKGTTHILTVHDLNFLTEKTGRKKIRYLNQVQKNVDNASVITAISNFTKSQIEENVNLKGKEVTVIYNGVQVDTFIDSTPPDYLSGLDYFFSIGIFNEKKNFHALFDLMHQFADKKLVIAGVNTTAYGAKLKELIVKKGLTDKIILVGPVSEKDKYWLYKNCTAFLFPSLAEGFGLPVIEAMQLGAPVITSDCGSLKEVGGNVASYFTDWNSECMAQVIQEKLDKIEIDPHSFRENSRMHAEQFSWSRSIKGYIDLYERLLSSS